MKFAKSGIMILALKLNSQRGEAMVRTRALGTFLLVGLLLASPRVGACGEPAMFSFGDMVRLQAKAFGRPDQKLGAVDSVLFSNLEFYVVTVFETLHAANNAAVMLHEEPLFCAPEGVFRFEQEGEIAALAGFLGEELVDLTEKLGGDPARYDDRPASEVLLLGLRAAFPCDLTPARLSAMR